MDADAYVEILCQQVDLKLQTDDQEWKHILFIVTVSRDTCPIGSVYLDAPSGDQNEHSSQMRRRTVGLPKRTFAQRVSELLRACGVGKGHMKL